MIAMYIMILNPNSGSGRSLQLQAEIEAVLHQEGIEYRIESKHSADETIEVVRRSVEEKPEGIIALGGDGTLYRVANGMAGSDVPLIFIPCGTGNDFVRMLNLPKDPLEALKLQLHTPVSRIDVGRMNDNCFLNVSGTGFDVDVLHKADAYKEKYSGLRPYLFGLVKAIRQYRPMTAFVSLDDGPEQEMKFAIISIGNGRYFGGGMKAVPTAAINDGYFDVVVVKPVKKISILPLLTFYIIGKHVDWKLGKLYRCKKISIRREGTTFNLDGELLDADIAKYEILPGALAVRVPGL